MDQLPDELLEYFFSFINWGTTFKTILFTCKHWYTLQLKVIPEGKNIFANHLLTLLKLFPDKPWNWYWVSRNPNITWEIISANPDKPWNWNEVSRNPNITCDMICANPDKPWNWSGISSNPNITWEIISANPDKPWNWDRISCNNFRYLKN
jgi:hypothetical protein